MGKAKDAATLGVHLLHKHRDVIAERADACGLSVSRYAAAIIAAWIEAGCPPVTPADAALQTLKGSRPPKPGR